MTHQELYDTLRLITPGKFHVSVKYVLNDYDSPRWEATAWEMGPDLSTGFYATGKTPEEVLIQAVTTIAPQLKVAA